MRSNRAGRTSEINPLQMTVCEGVFFSPHHSPHGYKNQTFSSPFSGRPRPDCGLHTGQVRRLGCVGASILKHRAFEIARHHVGQVGHVGQAANNSEAYQRFFLPDMAFPMSGACRACRARPTSWGHQTGRMEGHGPDAARGRHGRRAPHRTAFPLAAGLSGRPRPACGLHTGQVRRLGCVGASTLNRHVFEVARHHVKGTTKTPQGQELNLHTADINTPAPLPNRGTLAGDL